MYNMATNNLTQFLKEIADALRYVKGTTEPINPQEFAFIIKGLADKLVGEIDTENTISLIKSMVGFNGTYTLKYEDKQRIPLENFVDICTLTLTNNDAYYEDLIDVNIPPYLAESIGVYDSNNIRVGYISLNGFKPTFGERLYRVGLLSDVHDYEGSTAEPSDDFRRALNLFNNKEDVEMTCICGDISQNGTESEFNMYKTDITVQSPDTPVYTTTGNHDCGNSGKSVNISLWEQYTNCPIVFEISKTLSNGKTDHFLFLGMTTYSLGSSGKPYTNENISWLESKLKEYKNERCFIFTHLFFSDKAGNLNDIYPSANWLQGEQYIKLNNLCNKFVNSIWFSGHSHWKWALQKYQDRANIYRTYDTDGRPECGWCVHVPSCASPMDSDGSSRVEKPLESEGGVIDVYENYIDIRAIDLKNQKYLPIGTYRLNTEIFEVLDFIAISSDEFRHLPKGQSANNNGTDINGNTTQCPYAEFNSNTNTLNFYFDNTNQKLLYESALFISGTTKNTDILFNADSIKVYHNDVEITNDSRYQSILANGVGWYLTNGNYSFTVPTTSGVYAEYPTHQKLSSWGSETYYNGIQFNISNSKYYQAGINAGLTKNDLFPIRIELKGLSLAVSSTSEASEE